MPAMTIDSAWLFLYTPLPWLAVMYIVAYRHELARLAKPFKDRTGLNEWWSVCAHLGLIKAEAVRRSERAVRSGSLFTVLAIVGLDLIPALVHPPLEWYFLMILQGASSLVLFLILMNRIGPPPAKPYSDVLPYPRLGTRIRHLRKIPRPKRPIEKPVAKDEVRFFNVSLINGAVMSVPHLEEPQRLVGELIHSIEAASPRFAWVQFLFIRANFSPALVALKNSIHAATEMIKTPKISFIDGSESDRAELHRDWYRKAGERMKGIEALVNKPQVLLAIQGMWVGGPEQLSSLPFKDCYDDHDRLGIFTYRNPRMLIELVERRMVEDVSPYITSYARSRMEPPSFLLTPEEVPYYVHFPVVKEAESMKSVSFKQYSPATREGGVEGAGEKETVAPSKVLRLTQIPLITEPLKEKDVGGLSSLPSSTVRGFEVLFSEGRTELLVSSRSDPEVKEYVGVLESVYGELGAKETPAKPSFLKEIPRIVGLSR